MHLDLYFFFNKADILQWFNVTNSFTSSASAWLTYLGIPSLFLLWLLLLWVHCWTYAPPISHQSLGFSAIIIQLQRYTLQKSWLTLSLDRLSYLFADYRSTTQLRKSLTSITNLNFQQQITVTCLRQQSHHWWGHKQSNYRSIRFIGL